MANKLTGKSEVDVRNQVGTEGYFYRLPFDSTRKRMTTGLKYAGRDLIFMNGAS
jgi:magnesium-transporting ATPase (P-type)